MSTDTCKHTFKNTPIQKMQKKKRNLLGPYLKTVYEKDIDHSVSVFIRENEITLNVTKRL